MVLLVVRSGCADCGAAPTEPEVVGWVDPATGTFTAGPPPADAGPCEANCGCVDTICVQRCDDTTGDGTADTTYSELWCVHADGTTDLLLTYQDDPSVPYTPVSPVECTYACPETETITLCDDTGPFLRRYTFLNGQASYEDVELDGQTPHVVTGTVGICAGGSGSATGCVDTICVTRCDDTDGDGQPDATYSELWCVADDGTTSLLLTYAGDPSTPYVPVAPVPCVYGTTGSTDLVLCDEAGPFIRRITVTGGVATAEDFELDGTTPHVVTGTVGVCAGEGGAPCAEQTTPAATLGLCLPGGVPIAVVLTRDCSGVVTQDGWINLTTGTYSAGAPPAGAAACGDSRAFELTGILCDVDPATGDVLGLVLVEYEYNPDGSLASVRLVDPATGDTYTLQGELRHCPAGTAQPDLDLAVLCDVAADGTTTAFLRDWRRDENGVIVGYSDYSLDGTAYVPAGTVGTCSEPCRNTSTLLVCDLPTDGEPAPAVTDTDPTPYQNLPGADPVAGGAAALWSGGSLTIPPDTAPAADGNPQRVRTFAATVAAPRPACDTGTATVTAAVRVERTGPDDGCAGTGRFDLRIGGTVVAAEGVTPMNVPVGTVQTLTVSAQAPAADLAAGNVALFGLLETYHLAPTSCPGGSNPDGARIGGWVLDEFTIDVVFDQAGCGEQILANVVTDCETGQVESVTYTTLDGAEYEPTGTVGQCIPASAAPLPCPVQQVIAQCRCDDTDSDGIGDTDYVELLGVDCAGTLTSLGTYTEDLSALYEPVAPVACPVQGAPEPECPQYLLSECRWDDTDGDGLGDVEYVELIAVNGCTGALASIGTYLPDLSGPYTPIAPTTECPTEGAPAARGVRARRVQLGPGGTWDAATVPLLQSVTATAHGGNAQVTTMDGTTTLFAGESVTWSIVRDDDAALTGPLTITAQTAPVTITYTQGVQL
ncbi:hypothetical protein [Nonomuraea turcica]|uniref:hypothetical protein n=1 Tax=Nonomuraea sp. G32 TaxID=3067274 RepID=UPI00273B77EC|nr:hypothetical protein [Nonomuraea sp. G32]MDP4501060.1 hypothetical protein [Nonomuraea sp. G32]